MSNLELATLGAGCFWCVEAVFQQLRGVQQVVSGYAGGEVENPTYQQVCNGATGHAEVIQITFDPAVISFVELLEVFWRTHDPTTLRCWNPVPLGGVLPFGPAKSDGEKILGRYRRRWLVAQSHRHRDRTLGDLLPGGGTSPRLLSPQRQSDVLPGSD